MKNILLYAVIVLLLIGTVLCVILKYKYESDFLLNQSEKLDSLIRNMNELNPEQKAEIGKIASSYKYHIYTYNIVAILTFAASAVLIFNRNKMLKRD